MDNAPAVVETFRETALIAYLRPHNSRRFDILWTDQITSDKGPMVYPNEICYLKNVFPRIDCRVMLIGE